MSKLAECSTSLGESTRLKHASIIPQPKRLCCEFSTLPGYVFGVHVVFFLFVVLIASLACTLVSLPTGSCVGGIKKRITNGTSSRRTEIKTTCVLLFFLLWPRTMNNLKLCGYSRILLCEIKYRYCGLWWMERVSQISVTSTLKTFPKWPYKEFLKRCLQNKRSNWWKTESILNLNFTPFFISFQLWFFKTLFWHTRHQ